MEFRCTDADGVRDEVVANGGALPKAGLGRLSVLCTHAHTHTQWGVRLECDSGD